jgi:cysteinyl-tRNA synthetase
MLQIYNSLTKKKQEFKPIQQNEVGLYICGVTVYDYCHIGHARTYLAFDMIQRYLIYKGYKIKYIRNITDIDDKIIKRAQESQIPWQTVTDRFIEAMHEDLHGSLNTLRPAREPKATEFVSEMIHLTEKLIDKGYAYAASNGDVYYNVTKFKSYGCLAHRDLDDLIAGARIEVNEAKNNPLDFVLWKAAKPGEPSWDSPWGKGRPGWHIECSAMALDLLGDTFDIHGGGPDLKFPHHENERAISEVATGKCFVHTWMHVGYLQIDKEKMSKSTGNFITIREFLTQYHPEVLRYFNIVSHYRSPVEYSTEHMDLARSALERLYTALRGLIDLNEKMAAENSEYENRFVEAMDDDFNTPVALSVLFDLARIINRKKEENTKGSLIEAAKLGSLLKKLGNILGLLQENSEDFLQDKSVITEEESLEIEKIIQAREEARKTKDWARADQLRQVLDAKGIELEDTSSGTLWRKKSVQEVKEN